MRKSRMSRSWIAALTSALCAFSPFTPHAAHAETYAGIGVMDTFADVKRRFPGAAFEKLQPAWAQTGDVLYSISGEGMAGRTIVKFIDSRTVDWKSPLEESVRKSFPQGAADEIVRSATHLGELAESQALVVEWVRWIPDRPIPLRRFLAKYGQPTKRDLADEDLQPYCDWTPRGVTAFLNDSADQVIRVDYTFTDKERDQAFLAWAAKEGVPVQGEAPRRPVKPPPKKLMPKDASI